MTTLFKKYPVNTLFNIVGFLVIISFAVKLLLVIAGVDPKYTAKPHMVNSRVFTSKNSQYSILLGAKTQIFAEKDTGEIEEIQTRSEGGFNLSYEKVKSIIYIEPFDKYYTNPYRPTSQSKNSARNEYDIRYLAAAQLYCTKKEYTKITIKRVLVMQDTSQSKREFTTIIDCKDSSKK